MTQQVLTQHDLPPMPLDQWEDSLLYWQLMSQILGKIRLKLHPWINHWWHVPLYITPRGTTTGAIPYGDSNFDIELDLTDHRLVLRTGDGKVMGFALDGRPIAEFYNHLFDMLRSVGIDIEILARPYKCKSTEPFAADRVHSTYDPEAIHRALETNLRQRTTPPTGSSTPSNSSSQHPMVHTRSTAPRHAPPR